MIRDEKGRFASKEANIEEKEDFGYYSKLLQKPFNSVEELKKAEKSYRDAQKEKLAKIDQKKTLAHNVEEAYSDYMKTLEEGNRKISDFVSKIREEQSKSYNRYIKERNRFIETYGSFHMTFIDKKPQVDTENNVADMRKVYEDTLNNLFDAFKSFPFNF